VVVFWSFCPQIKAISRRKSVKNAKISLHAKYKFPYQGKEKRKKNGSITSVVVVLVLGTNL